MQSYRLALLIQDGDPADKILQKIDYFDVTLRNIEKGDPSRPLFGYLHFKVGFLKISPYFLT